MKIKNEDYEKMKNFLYEMDKEFKVPLSKRLNLNEYAKKLKELADVYIMVEENKIVGGIAFYKNDLKNYIAYITFVGVSKKYHNKGIANLLLKMYRRF